MKILDDARDHPIRAFAVLCVAITSGYIMWMGYRINEVLAGPTWCSRAIGADKADANSHVDAASSCIGLLTIQLKSLATNSHILLGSLALCLLTLIVVVIAGAKLAGKFAGGELNIDSAAAGAQAATNSAQATTDVLKEQSPPTGPGMPPPGVTP